MENRNPIIKDGRFNQIQKDPRYIRQKRKDTKIKIDSRFSNMLTDKDFHFTQKVDKYGRKAESTLEEGNAELKRLYRVDEDSDAENEETKKNDSQDEFSEEEDIPTTFVDRARGEGSESSDEESEEIELEGNVSSEDEILTIGKFGNGANYNLKDEEDSEDECEHGDPTKRLAVMNMDWDNINAVDLFKVFDAFKPKSASILSVTIYPSEFGKERMAREDREGPPAELFQKDEEAEDELLKNDLGEVVDQEKLRQYQRDRLLYYYAVVECDSVASAKAIYDETDGTEFEHSGIFFDLRFIPDEMEFNLADAKETVNDAGFKYKPKDFVSQTLQNSNAKITWDEDDQERTILTHKKFTKDDLKQMDFKAYLASSSDSDHSTDDEAVMKYRSLLTDLNNDSENEENEEGKDLEITFQPGLSARVSQLLDKKKERENHKDETVFEKYQRERKEKKKKNKSLSQEKSVDNEKPFSDDEVEIDEDDPFFQSAFKGNSFSESKPVKSKKSDYSKKSESSELCTEALLFDEETEKNHFDMKEIEKSQKQRKKVRGKKKNKLVSNTDEFKMNVEDERFNAIYTNSEFAIDPSSSKFRKTEAMSELLEERRKRSKYTQ